MGNKKRALRTAGIVIVAALILAATGLCAWYLLDRRDPYGYLPGRFVAYVQVNSVRKAYEEWIARESVERALAAAGFGAIRQAVVDLRGAKVSKSAFVRSLIDVRADLMLLDGGGFIGSLSLGPRSLVTRLAPIAGPLLSVNGLSFIKEASFSCFEYRLGERRVYAAPAGDLLIVSSDRDKLEEAFSRRGGQDRLAGRADVRVLAVLGSAPRGVRFLVDSATALKAALSWHPQAKRIIDGLEFPVESAIDLSFSGESIEIDAGIPARSSSAPVNAFLSGPGNGATILPRLPAGVSMCAGLRGKDLKTLIDALTAAEPKITERIAQADQAAKLALGFGFDELVYSWAGGEAAALQFGTSTSPIICLSVKDEALRKKRLDAALALPVFELTRSDYAGVSLTKVSFPWFVEALLEAANVSLPSPYLAAESGYLYLSADPDALAAYLAALRAGSRLADAPEWEGLLPSGDKRTLAYCVYDSSTRPFFLGKNWPVTAALEEFGRGSLIVSSTDEGLAAALAATRSGGGAKTGASFGFPIALNRRIDSFAVADFPGGGPPLLAAFGGDALSLIDPARPDRPHEVRVPSGSMAAQGMSSGLWSFTSEGNISYRGEDGKAVEPFPIDMPAERMPPLAIPGGLLVYDSSRKGLALVGPDGRAAPFGPALQDPVFAAPSASGGYVAYATKGFDSLAYVLDSSGQILPGWPAEGGGISLGSVAVSYGAEGLLACFLTQAGKLSLWTTDGRLLAGFPLDLDGVFYASPAIVLNGHERLAACADSQGKIYLVSEHGAVFPGPALSEAAGKSTRLSASDPDGDGVDALYVSGNANLITALAVPSMDLLPGFPMAGAFGPYFSDIDADGTAETISASRDGTINALRAQGD